MREFIRGWRRFGFRVEFWWTVEQAAGWLWDAWMSRFERPGHAGCWLDGLTGWACSCRYKAERRARPDLFIPEARRPGLVSRLLFG